MATLDCGEAADVAGLAGAVGAMATALRDSTGAAALGSLSLVVVSQPANRVSVAAASEAIRPVRCSFMGTFLAYGLKIEGVGGSPVHQRP